ncbi:MAG TPA: hypothetical protein VFW76_12225, partial [Ktedonobacterales bacterium]|nr:hypothetical protein [Ktedonobacterales bacterium]
PSVHFDEETTVIGNAPSPSANMHNTQPPKRPQRPRALGIIAAVVAATLVVVGFLAVYSSRNGQPTAAATATPQVTTAPTAIAPTATATPDNAPQPSAFVCANSPGSNLSYAYVRGDYHAYIVTGCTEPQKIPVSASYSAPLGWSPTDRYLAVRACDQNNNCPVVLYDPNSGQTHAKKYIGDYPLAYFGQIPDGHVFRFFIGWVDDNTFLGALQPVMTSNPNGSPLGTSTIVKVDVASGAETQVGKVAWFAKTKISASGYLFYAGLKTMSEGQAHLHRLDLSNGVDTQLVPLGEYGNGGCQVSIFCNWTAPWDVSPDGIHVIYHSPAPTTFPSDTNVVQDTPLVYAGIDGMNPSKPFGSKLAPGLSSPEFSPDGAYVLASGIGMASGPSAPQRFGLWRIDGSVITVDGAFIGCAGNNQALILTNTSSPTPSAFDLSSHAVKLLESNSSFYLWAN